MLLEAKDIHMSFPEGDGLFRRKRKEFRVIRN